MNSKDMDPISGYSVTEARHAFAASVWWDPTHIQRSLEIGVRLWSFAFDVYSHTRCLSIDEACVP